MDTRHLRVGIIARFLGIAFIAAGGCGTSPKRASVADLAEPPVLPCPAETLPAPTAEAKTRAMGQTSVRANPTTVPYGRVSVLQRAVRNATQRPRGRWPAGRTTSSTTTPTPLSPPATSAPSTQPIEMLCISGGGQYGAFGAGFLKGWSGVTGRTSRPSFDIVTGISTGSLISTFAFLGKDYDDKLEQAYLDAARGEPVFEPRFLYGLLLSDSIATRKGLEHRVTKMFTPDLLRAVAGATDGGRRSLLVGTVNLDSGRMTYWNLSRIAEIGVKLEEAHPGSGALDRATELYRTILLAGTAIPGALPPVLIDRDRYRAFFDDDPSCEAIVYPDWTQHATLHCDGGARQNVFAVQLASSLLLNPDRNGKKSQVNVYLIGNGTIHDDPQVTKRMVLPIGERAVSVLLTEAMRGSIATIALLGSSEGWHVKLAYLSSTECDHLLPGDGSIVDAFSEPFMRCIMHVGETRGASDDLRWNHFSELGLPDTAQPASTEP